MNRNALYLVIGVLAVTVAILSYQYYQEQRTSGITIDVGKGGMTIQTK